MKNKTVNLKIRWRLDQYEEILKQAQKCDMTFEEYVISKLQEK